MKRKLLRIIPFLLFGGVLGLAAAPAAFEAAGVKATEGETTVDYAVSDFLGKGTSSSGSKVTVVKNPVTFIADYAYGHEKELRVYSKTNNYVRISTSIGSLSSISFTFSGSDNGGLSSSYTFSNNETEWKQKVTAKACITAVSVTVSTANVTVDSISLDTSNVKTTYTQGEGISYSGLKVTANYSNSTSGSLDSSKYSISPVSGTVLNNIGKETVSVTYSGTSDIKTTSGEDLVKTYEVSIIQGEKPIIYSKVTNTSDLNIGDKIIFVAESANKAAKGTLTSDATAYKRYVDTVDIAIKDHTAEVSPTSDIGVYTVESGSIANTYSFKNESNKYLSTYAIDKDGMKFVDAKDAASSWTVDLEASNCNLKSNIANQAFDSYVYMRYNVSTFRAYKASSGVSETSIYKYSSGAERITVQSAASVLEEASITISSTAEGFTPSSYLWSVSDSEVLQIVGDSNKSSVTIKGLKPGSANLTIKADDSDDLVATCVVTVIAKKDAVIENGDYFVSNYSGTHILSTNLEDVSEPDYSDTSLMWTVQNNGIDGDTYTISSGSNYLYHSGEKTASSLGLSTDSSHYWVAEKIEDGVYYLSDSESGNKLSCNPGTNDIWYAYNNPTGDQAKIKLLKAGEFVGFDVTAPTKKQYFVGEELSTTNLKVVANFDNDGHAVVTNKVVWDKLTEGTTAHGTVEIGGIERDVVCNGIQVYKGDASTFVIDGLHDTYSIGEKINKDNLTVGITYKLSGSEDIVKDNLAKDDYTITPEKIEEGTEKIRIALAKDPTVYYEQNIEVKESNYVAAAHIYAGDTIILGTLGYNPYEITGGQELSYNGSKFSYEPFDYMPRGEMPLEVGKEGSYFTLKDPVTGYYLKGDNSSLGFNEPDYKSVYAEGDGHYELNLSVSIGGTSIIAKMKTTLEPDFADPMVFSSMDYVGGYEDYVVGTSHLDENKFTFDMWSKKNNYEEVYATAEVEIADWKFTGGAFYYALEISSTLPEECLFTMSYDEDFEEWVVSSKPHQDKQLYFNKDGKFGFYTRGSSYTPVMVFRDNDKPLQSEPTSVSVSFAPIEGTEPQEYMNTVSVGEQFPWTSALVVKVNYGGGASKVIPVGGYTMKQLPDTSKVGTATGIISYGQNGHQIDKPFTITVKGKTQAFDVVCKDPILVGETYQAHLDDHYEPPEGEPIKWSVSNPTLASIDQDGNVTGLKAGYVDVIATSFDGTYSDFEHVRIFQNVVSLSLDKTEMTLEAGTKETIIATVLPVDASNPNVTWSSSDPNIASVNSKGEVTGLSVGTTTITCTTQGKPFGAEEPLTASCEVTVTPGSVVRVTGVTLDCTYKELKPGDTFQLNAIVNPTNATNKNVTWESNAPHLADVNNSGKVTVKASAATGKTVYITAKTEDGSFTARCEIKIKASVTPVPVTSISLDITSKKIDVDETFEIVATINPSDASDKHIDWSSSNEDVVEIISAGPSAVTVKGMSDGTATITASCDGKTATCVVTVGDAPTPPPTPVHPVESVSLNESSIKLNTNDTFELLATVNPSDADNKKVTWSSSDEAIVTVNNGVVSAVAPGEVTITVTTVDGGKTATCKVQVIDKEAQTQQNIIVASAVGGTVAVGAGCGIGIPAGLKIRKRKLLKK